KTIVTITDRGVGMVKDKQDQLFKNLQVPTLGTDGEGGSGIGLLLSKELLSRNRGSFSIDSQPDVGSTFTISLPGKNYEKRNV
ncbi:MAG TPA: ATP-binding protein, partial [Sphingobacterium sp.]|nr:ATP-binding protein [Sphingobacterium sp.]